MKPLIILSSRKSILTLFVFLSSITAALSQGQNYSNLDVSFNINDKALIPAITFQHYFGIGQKKKLFIGPGVRLFGISSNSDWRFAETNALEDNFNDGDPNVNAFIANSTTIGAINLGIFFNYRFGDHIEIGLNTDLIGFSFSSGSDGIFTIHETGEAVPVSGIKSESFVLFPVKGSYNTEMFWIGYRFKEKYLVRLGFIFSDYKYEIGDGVVQGVADNAYERIFNLMSIGFSYKIE